MSSGCGHPHSPAVSLETDGLCQSVVTTSVGTETVTCFGENCMHIFHPLCDELLTYTMALSNLHQPGKEVVFKYEHMKSQFALVWLRFKEL